MNVPDQQPEPTVPDQQPEPTVPDQQPEPTVPDQQPEPTVPDQQPEPTVPDQQPEPTVPEPTDARGDVDPVADAGAGSSATAQPGTAVTADTGSGPEPGEETEPEPEPDGVPAPEANAAPAAAAAAAGEPEAGPEPAAPEPAAMAQPEPTDAPPTDAEPTDAEIRRDLEPTDLEPTDLEPTDAEIRRDLEPTDLEPTDLEPTDAEVRLDLEPEFAALIEEMERSRRARLAAMDAAAAADLHGPAGTGTGGSDESLPASFGSPPTDPAATDRTVAAAAVADGASAALDEPTAHLFSAPPPLPAGTARRRLLQAMRPRASRAQLVAFLLCAVLGFALFVSVRQTQAQGLSSLRQSDLFALLDNVTEKSTRLEDEARQLQQTADQLRSGSDRSAAAQAAARQRLDMLGILAGTAPAVGPGIDLAITDPQGQVNAATLLDIVQELRDAGAEAVQVGTTRVVASTAFVDDTTGVLVDGTTVSPPYTFLVIGDPQTLAAALEIPGGVIDTLHQAGATGRITQRNTLTVSALHKVETPQYAHPAQSSTP